jgi:hypothetical protein
LTKNALFAGGGKALAAGLTGNQGITELNISDNYLGVNTDYDADASGITAIADAIPDMGALTSLHVGKNNIPEKEMREIMAITMRMESMKILCMVPFKDKTLTELDVSGNNLGTEGALVVAEYLDGNGALTSLDISTNIIVSGIWMDPPQQGLQAGDLVDGKPIISIDEDDGQINVVDLNGIKALADAIPGTGAMTSLSLANNKLGAEGAKHIADAIKVN